jgi:DNA replication protein DnaC
MADLVANLKRLRLYGMAACVAEGLEQGHPAMASSTALLAQLVHAEAMDRATRSIRYQMHVARFPMHRDLAGFDFDQAKVDRRQITSFATTAFTEQAENVVLIGGTGTGKTHLATTVGIEAVTRHNKRVRFYSTVELVNTLEQEKASGHAGRLAHQISRAGPAQIPGGPHRHVLTDQRRITRRQTRLPASPWSIFTEHRWSVSVSANNEGHLHVGVR